MIDMHCHIDLYPDPKAIVSEVAASGMYVLSVTTTPLAWSKTAELASETARIKTALGIHPELAHTSHADIELFRKLLPQSRYVGEIGLDGSPAFRSHFQRQREVFTEVLQACQDIGGRILSIHSRRAASEVLDCLEEHPLASTSILHWFSGTQRELARACENGCWFSVGPAMVEQDRGRALIAAMPRDRVLPESDGPFVTVQNRPARPSDTTTVLARLADIWSVSASEAHDICIANLRRLVS